MRFAARSRGVHTATVTRPTPARAIASEVILALLCGVLGTLFLTVVLSLGVLPNPSQLPGLNYVYAPLGLLIAAVCYHQIARAIDIQEQPAVAASGWGATVATILSHTAIAVVGSFVLSWLLELVGFPVSEQEAVTAITEDGFGVRSDLMFLVLAALVLAPIAEEWLMRGLLFNRLRRSHVGLAYLLSALAFAAIHGNPAGFVIYMWLAVVFAHALARTDRLVAPIAIHALNNAITLALLLWGTSA